ncbi:MAG: hypothetical protein KBC57_02780 [Neisseriaceae bacterium]|nr:hypothetical protein [Neisseriaceae bacterium]MBP6861269.1 hypothetical protein [Neisseriaceae bacterium]
MNLNAHSALFMTAITCTILLPSSQTFAAPLMANDRSDSASCQVSAANGGAYPLGRFSSAQLHANEPTKLSPMLKTWLISCDAETYLTFSTVDHRADSVATPAANQYGLGHVNGTGKIGAYEVIMKNAAVDGVPTQVFASTTAIFNPAAWVTLRPMQGTHGWASAPNVLKSGKTFSADLEVQASLAAISIMNGPMTDNAEIDGSMSLIFAFGI